eukprot:m.290064 g.290064  ORF g.290064 m.290064 type:complete len:291 (+) comp27118_c0_seq5:283-1155(+)
MAACNGTSATSSDAAVVKELTALMQSAGCKADAGHGIEHVLSVLAHIDCAIGEIHDSDSEGGLEMVLPTPIIRDAMRLAALLHDADDRKLFTNRDPADPYANARMILTRTRSGETELHDLVLRMVSLVSTTGNGNSTEAVPAGDYWMLWPRYADRLEALGGIGVHRSISYSNKVTQLFVLPDTPRAASEAELNRIATPERFAAYVATGVSASIIDHFYDKLLHLGAAKNFEFAQSPYFAAEAARRHQVMVDFVTSFSATGVITMPTLPKGSGMDPVVPHPSTLIHVHAPT